MTIKELNFVKTSLYFQICRLECGSMGLEDLREKVAGIADHLMPKGYLRGWLSSWAKGGDHSTIDRLRSFVDGISGTIEELENE